MKFFLLQRNSAPPGTDYPSNSAGEMPTLVWPKSFREMFEEPQMQCLSLVRRQSGNVISMKLVLRSHEAE